MNKILPLIIGTILLTGCVYFNTVYHANTAYESGFESYREDLRQGENISNTTRNQFQRAVEKGKKILADHSDSKYVDDAYLLIGKSYYYLDQSGLAKNYLSTLINDYSRSPYREEARLFLGKAYFELEEYPLARHEFEFLIENSSSRSIIAQAYLALADLEKEQGNPSKMLSDVERAIEFAEDNEIKADAAWRTGQWAMDSHEYENAESFFHQAARFTRKPQFDRRIQVELIRIFRKTGKLEEARRRIQAHLSDEKFTDLYPELEIERGLMYESTGDTIKAAETYRYVTTEYSNTNAAASGYFYLGQLAEQRRDYEEAVAHYDKVSRMSSESRFVDEAKEKALKIRRLNRLYSQRKNKIESLIQSYAETLRSDSSETVAGVDTSATIESADTVSHQKKDRLDKASLKESLLSGASEPDTVEFSFADIYSWLFEQDSLETLNEYLDIQYMITESYLFDLNQWDLALSIADSILSLAKRDEIKAKTLLLKSYAYDHFLNQPERAAQLLSTVRSEYPDSKALEAFDGERDRQQEKGPGPSDMVVQLYNRADSLLAHQQREEAQKLFRQIHRAYPDSPYGSKSLYALGWVYETELMQLDSAIASYQKFTAQYPEHRMKSKVTQRLRDLQNIKSALSAATETDTTEQSAAEAMESDSIDE